MSEPTHDNESSSKAAQLGSAAKRTARNYLEHLKRNWAGGGKGKAIVAGEAFALILVLIWMAPASPSSSHAAASSESLGRELGVSVGTASSSTITPAGMNKQIENIRVFADDKDHTLTIEFNYVGSYRIGGVAPVAGLLVRLFDENGNYLTHFTTKTKFVPTDVWDYVQTDKGRSSPLNKQMLRALEIDGFSVVPVPRQGPGARVAYTVNARDLDYAANVEVGFEDPVVSFTDDD